MVQRVQRLRHNTIDAALFVGLVGEITIDQETGAIHVHDGTTPGGRVITPTAQLEGVFQGSDALLTALSDQEGSGLLVKKGAGSEVRTLTAGDNITITFGDGQAGDPLIEVSGLDENAFTHGTSGTYDVGTEDDELTTNAQAQALIDAVIPPGMIMLWHGSYATIPAGWLVCDGTNGTVNLVDKFVVGAKEDDEDVPKTNLTGALTTSGGAYSANTGAGGSHNHGGDTGGHALTAAENGPHTHSITAVRGNTGPGPDQGNAGKVVPTTYTTGSSGSGTPHDHAIPTQAAHTHTAPLVPYYALYYIQRVA